jgi:hypothetical protein
MLPAIAEVSFWRALVPSLAISEEGGRPAPPLPTAASPEELRAWLRCEGYYLEPGLVPRPTCAAMAETIINLRKAELPLVFAFVYDEFWHLGAWFRPILEALLGVGFRALPALWAWHLDPARSEVGWEPHRDRDFGALDDDGAPRSLTVWVPLTDATAMNGCIYVLPVEWDDNYRERRNLAVVRDVQCIRALPATAGTFACWNHALLHWGGRASPRAREPRLSYSIEFQRADIAPFNSPLIDASHPPPFELRMALIGKQLRQYRHMHDVDAKTAALADLVSENFPIK